MQIIFLEIIIGFVTVLHFNWVLNTMCFLPNCHGQALAAGFLALVFRYFVVAGGGKALN